MIRHTLKNTLRRVKTWKKWEMQKWMFFASTQIKVKISMRMTKFKSPHQEKTYLLYSLEIIKDLQWLGEWIFNHDIHRISNRQTTLKKCILKLQLLPTGWNELHKFMIWFEYKCTLSSVKISFACLFFFLTDIWNKGNISNTDGKNQVLITIRPKKNITSKWDSMVIESQGFVLSKRLYYEYGRLKPWSTNLSQLRLN